MKETGRMRLSDFHGLAVASALWSTVLLALLVARPCTQLPAYNRGQGRLEEASSVQGKLASVDNSSSAAQQRSGQAADISGAAFPTLDSTSRQPAAAARWQWQPSGEENIQTSRRLAPRPSWRRNKLRAVNVFSWKQTGGQTTAVQLVGSTSSGLLWTGITSQSVGLLPDQHRESASRLDSRLHVETSAQQTSRDQTEHVAVSHVFLSVADPQKAVLSDSRSQLLQQPRDGLKSHAPKMVLTAIGSVTAIFGICLMAAIFQCCCRRRKSNSTSPDPGSYKKQETEEQDGRKDRSSRSKSPSPQKVLAEEQVPDKGHSEEDKLLEEDEDLGDFSLVQRETEILRSYRKPPPPKNRARASRVPRALKTTEPNASPSVFQELVETEESESSEATKKENSKAVTSKNGLAVPETSAKDMQSSMLADIDNTLASLHATEESDQYESTLSQSRNLNHSRESSVEKVLATKANICESTKLKSSSKKHSGRAPSQEDLKKALARELSRSMSKENLSKSQSETASPKLGSKETILKSLSAGASPVLQSKKSYAAPEKKTVLASANDTNKVGVMEVSPGDEKLTGNIFTLIDPTLKDKEDDTADKNKSKIPVRAASNPTPTQMSVPLRTSAEKEKRFPVPSVHGEQMDQLLKSLKTRLNEDGSSSNRNANGTALEEESNDKDMSSQGRDRSHSDPNKQEQKIDKPQQTYL